MKIEKLAAIYVIVLGFVTFLCLLFPYLMSDFVNVFFPVKVDLSGSWNIRYRMALFISATIIMLIFVPIIWSLGFYGTDINRFKKLSWKYFIVIIPATPSMWLYFPYLSLCQECWTRNDAFYFFLTVGFFIALHGFIQATILKITLKLRGI